jgi:hypothetical protein
MESLDVNSAPAGPVEKHAQSTERPQRLQSFQGSNTNHKVIIKQ